MFKTNFSGHFRVQQVIDKMTYAALCGKLKDEFGRSVIYDGFSAATKVGVAARNRKLLRNPRRGSCGHFGSFVPSLPPE